MVTYVHEIACNITSYCRQVITTGSHDPSYCRVLFSPSLSEAVIDSNSYSNKITPKLGTCVLIPDSYQITPNLGEY